MNLELLAEFGLTPDVVHLNHGAFGCVPKRVRARIASWQGEAESNPHRFHRVDAPGRVADARRVAADFLGVDADACGLVRNVSEGVSAVLASLDLEPGDQIVVNNHGYGSVLMAVRHWARRRALEVVVADFDVRAREQDVVDAYRRAVGPRTRLAIVDQITSSTAAVLPVAEVAAAIEVPVLVDAAHVPGTLPTDVEALGVAYWVGNLHKWCYTPRGSAVLWASESVRDRTTPTVLSWQLEDGYARAFDMPATCDYSGWLSIAEGLDFWRSLGGAERVSAMAAMVSEGQRTVACALGTSLDGLVENPAPTMRLVRLPEGVLHGPDDADAMYEALSAAGIEAVAVWFDGAGYVRVSAAAYNTAEDYEVLGKALVML